MKKSLIVALVLVLILAVVVGIGTPYWQVWTADCIVRVHYIGFSQLFHEPYAYYAICGDSAVRVDPRILEQLAPEAISGSKYKNTDATQWFTHLYYVPYLSYFESEEFTGAYESWLPTAFGENYRVYYQRWAGTVRKPDEQELWVLVEAAETLHSGDINDMSSTNGIERGLTWYILVSNGEKMLLQLKEDALYLPMEDGTFRLLMECPDGGQFDYYWFP